jgi:RHS repeat-associated protein
MIARTDGTGTTTFVWDGMDCVMETDPSGNVTRYYVIGGLVMSFDRTSSGVTTTYQLHCDALACIRKVTETHGNVVATYDFDAYGNPLTSTSDATPNGGLQYRFVGGLGVRWDAGVGLYYMRHRWYDPVLKRFLSRDPLHNPSSTYTYCEDRPTSYLDPEGLYTPTQDLLNELTARGYQNPQQFIFQCIQAALDLLAHPTGNYRPNISVGPDTTESMIVAGLTTIIHSPSYQLGWNPQGGNYMDSAGTSTVFEPAALDKMDTQCPSIKIQQCAAYLLHEASHHYLGEHPKLMEWINQTIPDVAPGRPDTVNVGHRYIYGVIQNFVGWTL